MHTQSIIISALTALAAAQHQYGYATPENNDQSGSVDSQQQYSNSQQGQPQNYQAQNQQGNYQAQNQQGNYQAQGQQGNYQAYNAQQNNQGVKGTDQWSTSENQQNNQYNGNQQQSGRHDSGANGPYDTQQSQQKDVGSQNSFTSGSQGQGSAAGHQGTGLDSSGNGEQRPQVPLNFNTASSSDDESYEQNDVQLGKLNKYSTKASQVVFIKDLEVELDLDSIVCQVFKDEDGNEQAGNTFSNTQPCDLGDEPIEIKSVKCWAS